MQFLLMAYVQEGGWETMTKAQQEQGLIAYKSFTDALKQSGALVGSNRLAASSNATDDSRGGREDAGAGWAVRGYEGAARRIFSD